MKPQCCVLKGSEWKVKCLKKNCLLNIQFTQSNILWPNSNKYSDGCHQILFPVWNTNSSSQHIQLNPIISPLYNYSIILSQTLMIDGSAQKIVDDISSWKPSIIQTLIRHESSSYWSQLVACFVYLVFGSLSDTVCCLQYLKHTAHD